MSGTNDLTTVRQHESGRQQQLEGIVASAMDAFITVDESQRITLFNPAAETMFRRTAAETLGQNLSCLIPERHWAAHAAHVSEFLRADLLNRKMRADDAIRGVRTVSGLRPNGEEFPIEASISKITVDGAVFATVVLRDITEQVANEQARDLLAREVDHRAKNVLAVVQALVSMTKASNNEDFVHAVQARISALARSHSILAQSRWEGVDLIQIARDETAPYQDRVSIQGPSVVLRPNTVQSVSLIFHELVTNAAKYGALSAEPGRVSVHIAFLPDGDLQLRWSETGGPAVTSPGSNGFGSKLITRLITQQLGGTLHRRWPKDGLHLVATLPAAVYQADHLPDRRPTPTPGSPALDIRKGRRVLVVEDELLVGEEIGERLTERGWEVVGPAATIEEAETLLQNGPPLDAAVLDVNLRGRLVYPIADLLSARGVPFVFCTGYEQVDLRYRHISTLRKPVNGGDLDAELHRIMAAA